MKKITVSAPGKLMLLGDHAVVHNRPCLVTAVDQRMEATVTRLDVPELQLEAPGVKVIGYKKSLKDLGKGEIPKGAKFVEIAVKNFLKKYQFKGGLRVETSSAFSSQVGFGSSSASTVCMVKALSELTGSKLDNKSLFNLAYKTVIDIQGVGSGFDIAAGIYGGILYFVGGGKVITPISVANFPLIVGYSGSKGDTPTLVKMVGAKLKEYPKIYPVLFDVSTTCVETGKKALIAGDFEKFGELMNINEGLLSAYGVETETLAAMNYAARSAGAYGAKLSGAGGGDCMIALALREKKKDVEKAITVAGGEVIAVKTNAEGVRVEKSLQ
ncbi:MAG TPA: mevalonate kinase [Candidatus Acidoferrales bacterium]|nr:mevalonate kinase [Candidatus Acidoferrales bacterium]